MGGNSNYPRFLVTVGEGGKIGNLFKNCLKSKPHLLGRWSNYFHHTSVEFCDVFTRLCSDVGVTMTTCSLVSSIPSVMGCCACTSDCIKNVSPTVVC